MSKTITVLFNSVRDVVFDVVDNNGNVHKLKINGSCSLIRDITGHVIPMSHLLEAGAYGITRNVDADLWDKVVKDYGSMNIFKLGYIKATTPKTEEDAKAELSEKANGEEPVKKRGSKKSE